MVGVGGGVRQPRVNTDNGGPGFFAFHDALSVGVEVVACFKVGGNKKDHLGVSEIGRWPVEAHPCGVAHSGPARTNIGVAVMAVNAPRVQDPFHVTVVAHAPHVVHDFVFAFFPKGFANAVAYFVEGLIPGDLFPEALTSCPDPFHRMQNAFRVFDLVNGGWAFGAVTPPASRVYWVAFELGDLAGVFIYPCQKATGCFAIETSGGY